MKKDGFTLIEVLLASVILALGTLLLHESYMRVADLYGRTVSGMQVQSWAGDRLWEAREALVFSAEGAAGSDSGSVQLGAKTFDWSRETTPLPGRGLYSIRLRVSWQEGNKPVSLEREIYAFRKQI